VVDFGLARREAVKNPAADQSAFTRTAPGLVAGTVSYMSPEQALGPLVDARSDSDSSFSIRRHLAVISNGRSHYAST
jgi:serine/threonine protein kinase